MAAGLGFKDFATGEVLTAADVDGYLMQGVWVFASATARDAAVTSPQEGNFAYLKDTNVTTYYTGSAWANLDTTGMTNPMTTTGDMIYSSSGSTPARLGLGTASQQLRVNSGATAPEWFTPAAASSGLTLIGTPTTFSAVSSQAIDDVFSSTYENYKVIIELTTTSAAQALDMKFRASGATNSSAAYSYGESRYVYSTNVLAGYTADVNTTNGIRFGETLSGEPGRYNLEIFSPQASKKKFFNWASSNRLYGFYGNAFVDLTTSFDGIIIIPTSGTITGTVYVYGYAK